jgi:iron complex outermembrane receptor protein
LVSVTSYQDWSYRFEQDVDGTEFNIAGAFTGGALSGGIYQIAPFEADQITQELRLESPQGDSFDYIVGLWYSDAETSRVFDRQPLFVADWDASTGNTNVAVFGQINWHLSERLDLSLGGRFGREEIEVTFNDDAAGTNYKGDDSETFTVGKAALQYFLRDDLSTFVSVSTGYKGQGYDVSSGFNLERAQNPVGSESAVSYEAGIKGAVMDGRAQFSVVAFLTDYDDFQAQSGEVTEDRGIVVALNNVGELRTQGIEAEFAMQLSANWRMDASAAFVDATIESFSGANCYPGQTEAEGCVGGVQDLGGEELANSPDWKYNLGLTYETELAGLPFSLFGNGNYSYQDDVNFDLFANPRTVQEGYGIANFTFGIEDNEGRYRITAFVNNAFDERYASIISDNSGFYGGSPVMTHILPRNSQRYAGLRARWSF